MPLVVDELLVGATVGAIAGKLLDAILAAKDKICDFKFDMERLQFTLQCIIPKIGEIKVLNDELNYPESPDIDRLKVELEKGMDLISKCSTVKNSMMKVWYSAKLKKLNNYLETSFSLNANVEFCSKQVLVKLQCGNVDQKRVLENLQEMRGKLDQLDSKPVLDDLQELSRKLDRLDLIERSVGSVNVDLKRVLDILQELSGKFDQLNLIGTSDGSGNVAQNECQCAVPEIPFSVGLDVRVKELKMKLFRDIASMIGLCAHGESGKTTLAVNLCGDEQVKEIFKDNIIFLTVSSSPDFKVLVDGIFRRLCDENQFLKFQIDEDAEKQLRYLMKQKEGEPILLVLDDVWEEQFLKKFVFRTAGHKILVTSRTKCKQFDFTCPLKMLSNLDSISLFRHFTFPQNGNYEMPDEDCVEKIVRTRGSRAALIGESGGRLTARTRYEWETVKESPVEEVTQSSSSGSSSGGEPEANISRRRVAVRRVLRRSRIGEEASRGGRGGRDDNGSSSDSGGRGRGVKGARTLIPAVVREGVADTPLLTGLSRHVSMYVRMNVSTPYPFSNYRGDWRTFMMEFAFFTEDLRGQFTRAGFGAFLRIPYFRSNRLIFVAMMERWFPATHTFHMPETEIGIRPSDFVTITGISMEGEAMFPHILSLDEIAELIGAPFIPATEVGKLHRLGMRFLWSTLGQRGRTVRRGDADFASVFRLSFLLLLGSCFFLEDDSTVMTWFLTFLRDIQRVATYDWGSLIYGTILGGLDRIVKGITSPRGGRISTRFFWPFIELFVHVQFPYYFPTMRHPDEGYPLGAFWATRDGRTIKNSTRSARAHFDRCRLHEIFSVTLPDLPHSVQERREVWAAFDRDMRREIYPCFIGRIFYVYYFGERLFFQHDRSLNIPTTPVTPSSTDLSTEEYLAQVDGVSAQGLLVKGDYISWFRTASIGCIMPTMPMRAGITEIGGVFIREHDDTVDDLRRLQEGYSVIEAQAARCAEMEARWKMAQIEVAAQAKRIHELEMMLAMRESCSQDYRRRHDGASTSAHPPPPTQVAGPFTRPPVFTTDFLKTFDMGLRMHDLPASLGTSSVFFDLRDVDLSGVDSVARDAPGSDDDKS